MFAGVGGFRSGLTNAGDFFVPVGWCEIDPFAQKAYRALYETEGEYFCDDATQIKCEDLPEIDLITAGIPCRSLATCCSRFQSAAEDSALLIQEVLSFMTIVALRLRSAGGMKPGDLLIFCSKTSRGYWVTKGGKLSELSLPRFMSWGILLNGRVQQFSELNCKTDTNFGVPQQRRRVYIVGYLDSRLSGKIFPLATSNGTTLKQVIPGGQGQRVYSPEGASTCLTSQGGGWGAKTGLYFVDMNADPKVTHEARCITARQDSGISNRKGEHSGVIITGARAVLTPERENVRQQGRRMKDPDEPMFTLTAMDKHGVEYNGRV